MEKNNLEKKDLESNEISEHEKKKLLKKQNNQLKIILIVLVGIIALIFLGILFIGSLRHTHYHNVDFETTSYGQLILYNAKYTIHDTNNKSYAQSIYLRTEPKKLLKVPFEGNLTLKKDVIINSDSAFSCNGDGAIAVANLGMLYKNLGMSMGKNSNYSCDSSGRYTYLFLKTSNETKVMQTGPSCYDIEISNCEILPATERLMIEIMDKVSK